MPNSPNLFFLRTTEHLIFLVFNGIYYYIELKKNTEKNLVVSKYEVRANSGPFFPSTKTVPSQSIVNFIKQNGDEGKARVRVAKHN